MAYAEGLSWYREFCIHFLPAPFFSTSLSEADFSCTVVLRRIRLEGVTSDAGTRSKQINAT